MEELCVACNVEPNCDNDWYKSGLCRTCLYISRQGRCEECYNSILYCVCEDGEERRHHAREKLAWEGEEARLAKASKQLATFKLAGLPKMKL